MRPRRSSPCAFLLAVAATAGCNAVGNHGDDGDTSVGDATGSTGAHGESGPGSGADGSDGDATGSSGDGDADASSSGGGDDGDGCGAIVAFADGLAPSSERHVATGGTDAEGCGAVASPCATLQAALAGITPGTAVRIHAGSYAGGTFAAGLAGSQDAPIWIGGAPGEARPVIEGGDVAIHLAGARYVVLHDLEIRNTLQDGLNLDDGGATADPDAARWIELRGLFIHDIGTGGNNDCLKLSGVNDYLVRDGEFAACGDSGSAIDQVGCHRGLVVDNLFRDLPGPGNAVQTKGGSEDVEIRGNRFDHAGERAVNMGGSTGFEYFRPPLDATAANAEARDIRVVSNRFVGSISPIAVVGCVGCLVAHNTIVDPEHWVLRILQESVSGNGYEFAPASDTTVVDNLVVFARAQVGAVVNVGPQTAPETFTFSHNLWFAHDDPGASDPGLPVTEDAGIVGVDPMLREDLGIDASSPAAGAGVVVEGVDADANGRCWAAPPSIGAFEVP
ncbi:MAG: right-handed parallel beta-helix repeat-containing protein [Nannocystaceae bacterium]|nr:right-handed parallel beta-helix repeat-containing protein [Nannocystaceae bacterium]